MNIFQSNRRIGYVHKRLTPKTGGYKLEEKVLMRINTMGLVQAIRLHTQADLFPDLALERFEFEMATGRLRFSARGTVAGEALRLHIEEAGTRRTTEVALKRKHYLSATVIDTLPAADLEPGDRYSFDIFDPVLMAQSSVQVEVIGREEIQMMEARIPAIRISTSLRGLAQTAWIAENGELLRERGLLGMRLEKATRREALGDEPEAGQDLAELASISPDRELPDPHGLEMLRVRLGGADAHPLQLRGGRQRFAEGVLTVVRENLTGLPELPPQEDMGALERVFLRSEAFIQSDHEQIRSLVRSILGDSPQIPALAKARLLMEWVHRHIEKRPVLSVPDALSTLENRKGDCNEHAMLLAALARAAGIPARIEAGLVYMKGRFYYHAWNLLFLGRWVTADALFGQLPADVTHLRLVTGSLQQQVDLIGAIGTLTIEILE